MSASWHSAGRLRVKLGIDPTAPDIHLGFTNVLQKLREFQDLGHTVVLLIVGDYTARVGDPSGPLSTTRPVLAPEQIDANARTFQAQAMKVLDRDRLEVRFNSEWLDMSMEQLFALLRTTTVAQLLERDDFAKRFSARQPISVLELLYPLLQGYDSVAVRADVELGGTDQKFNLLLGRDIQRAFGAEEQVILTVPTAHRDRWRAQDVEVVRQLHRCHRRARRDVRQNGQTPDARSNSGTRSSLARMRRRTLARGMRSVHSRARWLPASTARGPPPRPRRHSIASTSATRRRPTCPRLTGREVREGRFTCRP